MQVCSVLHVAHVVVRRVTVVIVHIGHEDVVVVIHFCVAISVVIFCIRRCSLYTKCGQSSADELDLFASIRARTNNVQYFASWEVHSACLRNVPGHVSLRGSAIQHLRELLVLLLTHIGDTGRAHSGTLIVAELPGSFGLLTPWR